MKDKKQPAAGQPAQSGTGPKTKTRAAQTAKNNTPVRVGPGLPPLVPQPPVARALILGSFPSPKSRAQGFYYGHPQNRFWPVIAALTGSPAPSWQDLNAKRALICEHGLALWDSICRCTITGASDASVRDVEPNDVAALIRRLGVEAVFCNGTTSHRLYERYCAPQSGLHALCLPSTSPANASWSLLRLTEAWAEALGPWLR